MQLSNGSPDFSQKYTEEALWIDRWNVSQWPEDLLNRKIGSEDRTSQITSVAEQPQAVGQVEFAWTASILRHFKCGQYRAALKMYAEMKEEGVKPSSYTFVAALKACRGLRDVVAVKRIHADVLKNGFESDVYVGNMLVDVYVKCGSLSDAKDVFERMPQRDVISWNALMLGYAQMDAGAESLRLYAMMIEQRFVPDSWTFVAALKACISLANLQQGTESERVHKTKEHLKLVKSLHRDILKRGFESDVYVGNILIDVYAKCGSLLDARQVFENMPQRNVVSWTAMILGYAQTAECAEALHLYEQMQREGTVPNDQTFVGALKACKSLVALEEGNKVSGNADVVQYLEQVRVIHSDILKSGSESAVFVATMLIDVYVKCGSLLDARVIFDEMTRADVVSWNAMIFGYVQMKQGEEAVKLYARMQQEGVVADARTFVGALKACSCLASSCEELHIHTRIAMEKRYLVLVKTIHSDIVKSGFMSDVFVSNMLVDAYVKCGSLVNARNVFDSMSSRNVVSWSSMILGYAQVEQGGEALNLYTRMQAEGVEPNDRTFVAALKACSSLANISDKYDAEQCSRLCPEQLAVVHSDIVKRGFETDVFVGTMLVDVLARCGDLPAARRVFDKISQQDVASWNAMILGYAQMEQGEKALQMYTQMQQRNIVPDSRTFVGVLKACTSLCSGGGVGDGTSVKLGCLEQVGVIHSDIVQSRFQSDVFLGNILVDVYAKLGDLVNARRVFETLPHRNVVAWTSMILGYAQMEEGEAALHLYAQMQLEGVQPNNRTVLGALKACGIVADLEQGKRIHRYHQSTDVFLASTLIDMYSKCGSMDDAQQVFDTLTITDVVTWNALMSGYALRGDSENVFDLFHRMVQEGQQPDGCTFLTVLTACNHVGLVDKGQQYFEAMIRVKSIVPTIEHYSCLADLFARVGQVEKALRMVEAMPSEAPSKTWRCLLSGCQKWGMVELGRHIFDYAIGADKNDAAAYVLMSNIYTAAGMPEAVKEIQNMRVQACAWKKPGQSWWTEAGGTVHAFVVGDQEHPESQFIYAELQKVSGQMEEEGNIAGVSHSYEPGHGD